MSRRPFTHWGHGGKSDCRRSAGPGQGFRRQARGRRRQPDRPRRQHLRHPRPQRRRQDDHAPHAARHHRSDVGHAAACLATTGRSRPRARSATCPRSAASIRRCRPPRRSPSWARCAACRSRKAGAGRSIAQGRAGMRIGRSKPIRTLSKGMAQTVQLLGTIIHRPAPDRPRRALLRPRRDQPGEARAADPRPGRGRRDDHLLDPCHRPCRAAVRADRDHRRGQGGVRGRGRRGARPAAPDRPSAHPRRGRAVARGAPGIAPSWSAANGGSSCPRAAPSRCSRR